MKIIDDLHNKLHVHGLGLIHSLDAYSSHSQLIAKLCLRLITLAAFSGEHKVTVWRPSVRPFVCPVGMLPVTHQGQHATRPAYILARQ